MESLAPANWNSWWYGAAAGMVFTIILVVIALYYSVHDVAENIKKRYPSEQLSEGEPFVEEAKPSTLFLYESEQLPIF